MTIKPLFDRVLLKPYQTKQTTTLIAPTENESNKMVVINTGHNHEFSVKENDIVLINKYSGSEFTIDNQKYVLIKECDILGILEDKNNE